ncbi:putative ribonuclease H protein [Acorus calamus]|uniref:Ribonuclease H protein n=1 Tax=Acorus calamus TaxID=4465 RepID=A0AAV9EDS7_ACOCL|nr:putative ribonuclease H protein [Acorus calamus]
MEGLGVLDLRMMNNALLSKWLWKWVSNPSSLWARCLRERYGGGRVATILPTISSKMTFIAKGWFGFGREFKRGLWWKLGRGDRIRFWKDRWCGDTPLWSKYPLLFHLAEEKEALAGEVWQGGERNGEWRVNFRRISNELQVQECADLLWVLEGRMISDETADEVTWEAVPSLGYKVEGGYAWWSRDKPVDQEMAACTPRIWKIKMPSKIKIFLWLALQNRLLTKMYRAKWRPTDPMNCELCQAKPETTEHLLLRCPWATRLWRELGRATGARLDFQALAELRVGISTSTGSTALALPAQLQLLLLPAGLWALWRTRNWILFRGHRLYFENIWDTTLHLLQEWGKHLVGLRNVYLSGGGGEIRYER